MILAGNSCDLAETDWLIRPSHGFT